MSTSQDACSAATIDVTSLPMRTEQGGYRVYCVCLWPYPRCGSDRLPYIQQIIVKLESWAKCCEYLEKIAETIAMMSVKYVYREKTLFHSGHLEA